MEEHMPRWKYIAAGACLATIAPIAALAAASPTSSGKTSSGCPNGVLSTLTKRLNSYRGVPKFVPPGPAFDASKARGKTIFNVPLLSTDTFNQIVDKAEAAAAKTAGLKFVQYTNQGSPAQWVAGVNQGIAQKADLILLEGSPDPRLLGPQLAAAKQAGIPVISTHLFDTSVVNQQLQALPNLSAIVPANHYLGSGTLTADYAIVSSKCNVNAILLEATDVQPTSPGIDARFTAELKKWCPSTCKASVVASPFSEWATKAQAQMQSAMTKDSAINFIAPNYDQGAVYARAAIIAAGAQNRVKIVAYNGSAPIMQMIQDKKSVIVDIGEPYYWLGYANIDQALRVLTGTKPLTNERTPLRLWDASNVDQAGKPVSQTKGYGPSSAFVNGYKKLWGIG
jgi:ribose transport system substrate-binding protein